MMKKALTITAALCVGILIGYSGRGYHIQKQGEAVEHVQPARERRGKPDCPTPRLSGNDTLNRTPAPGCEEFGPV